jgi:hypothetical protein
LIRLHVSVDHLGDFGRFARGDKASRQQGVFWGTDGSALQRVSFRRMPRKLRIYTARCSIRPGRLICTPTHSCMENRTITFAQFASCG